MSLSMGSFEVETVPHSIYGDLFNFESEEHEQSCSDTSNIASIPFMVGDTLHTIRLSFPDEEVTMDGFHVGAMVGEMDALSGEYWIPLARGVVLRAGVQMAQGEGAVRQLARQMGQASEYLMESLRDRCRRHFSAHGGMGPWGRIADPAALRADPCCQRVEDELLQFYIGLHGNIRSN